MTMYYPYVSADAEAVQFGIGQSDRAASFYHQNTKRWIDFVLVLLTLPVVAPLIALMCLFVMLDGHNPFYSQQRIGRGGRVFRMWKMRSMVPGASAALQTYLDSNPKAQAEWNATQKLRNDPRITLIGRVLRKTSLDELPQLWNVLNGTMSLVGPRPMMVCQQDLYPGRAYYALRPGITGLWQVSDRNDSTFAGRAVFDDRYSRSVSFGTDLRVLRQTVGVVLRANGH
ncbi:sugar transferase [Primorskyibacter flagellatus]|uniref:Sugar transferase involved in LPS biosynthesis (Colanic, teichoic acid) n=1 Tax=Primorskyibacter flagellatus TaxID=1387277 RepID=A0A1W2EQF5_9RHOB|nr:sugar transferase [Primorskyibacter flagellatus]SMD11368.1 Sugar transferase involved in LPS biosynthesis (colanic, teichoic acid) [Primorskyibacter flagellatus]